jgi:hypothetical protein
MVCSKNGKLRALFPATEQKKPDHLLLREKNFFKEKRIADFLRRARGYQAQSTRRKPSDFL